MSSSSFFKNVGKNETIKKLIISPKKIFKN